MPREKRYIWNNRPMRRRETQSYPRRPDGPSIADLVLFGDSVSALTYLSAELRWGALLAAAKGWTVTNYSDNGRTTEDYLPDDELIAPRVGPGSHPPVSWPVGRRYLIHFGYNDISDYSAATMKIYTSALIRLIKKRGHEPILMTQPGVDYAGGKYSWDRNAQIEPYNETYRELATEQDIHLVDFYATVSAKIAIGQWDNRTRNASISGIPISDSRMWSSSPLDVDGFGGSTPDPLWFTNIHPDPVGAEWYRDELAVAI